MSTGAWKNKAEIGREEIFQRYNELYSKLSEHHELTGSQHSKILNLFNKNLSNSILNTSLQYILPSQMGILRIRKKERKKLRLKEDGSVDTRGMAVNWKATKELWERDLESKGKKKLVYHTNEHTDGCTYRWYYSNYRCVHKNKTAYYFNPSRTNSRNLAKLLKDPEFKGDFYL